MTLPEIDYSKLSPGIRETVRWLRSHGFDTCDSGDGSNHAAGMEGAVPFPMVVMRLKHPAEMFHRARRLRDLLWYGRGVSVAEDPDGPHLEASYDPSTDVAFLVLTNVVLEPEQDFGTLMEEVSDLEDYLDKQEIARGTHTLRGRVELLVERRRG